MLAGLSGLYILRMPPGFCAEALPEKSASSKGVAAATPRRCRFMWRPSRVRARVRRIGDTRGGTLLGETRGLDVGAGAYTREASTRLIKVAEPGAFLRRIELRRRTP